MAPSRRSVLKGLLAGSAATAASGLMPGMRRRRAQAASGTEVYPTIFIMLRGGVDPAMHFDAKTGYVNRNVQAGDIRETPGGIRWYEPVLAPMTNHIADCTVIRNISCSSSHLAGWALSWYGEGGTDEARAATPWTAYLSNELLKRKKVPAANLVTYVTTPDQPITDFIPFNNSSPSALATAQRVQKLQDMADGLDVLQGQPSPEFQSRVFQTVSSMDAALYSPTVQPLTNAAFTAANSQATDLLTQPLPSLWPPDAATQALFNLDAGRYQATVAQGNQEFDTHLAFAYTMARLQLSHAMYIQATQVGWDTHEQHDSRQRSASAFAFTRIERLIAALKATESPVEAGKSMFDTTHVVITSDISRANSPDNGQDLDGTGTPHWPWTQAILMGGNFKRDYAFGAVDGNQQGVPADFNTGAMGQGRNPTFKELHATILKANGVDPTGWTSAPPINAVLK